MASLKLHLLAALFLAVSLTATSTIPNYPELKSLHFSYYQHEKVNETGHFIVNGTAGTPISQTTLPFGTIFAFQDPMTETSVKSSKQIGVCEGFSLVTSFDGLQNIFIAKFSLNLESHKGSITVVGVTHNTEAVDLPVVGGTDDFLFVQGYISSAPELVDISATYKIDFHLYWPPYATLAKHTNTKPSDEL